MKTRLILFILFTILIAKVCGQEQSNSDQYPLLIPVNESRQRLKIEIPCKCITDSLEVVVSVGVHFDNEVSDTTTTLTPIKIYIGSIIYHKGTPKQIYLSNKQSLNNSYDRCIWKTCSDKFLVWMECQPYSRFFNRENQPKGGKGLSFTYKVMLTPDIELP